MLIYDVLHKEKVYQIVSRNLRSIGVKYRIKKNVVKTDKPDRHGGALKKVFKTPLSYLPLDVVNLSSGAIVHVPVFVCHATTFILQNVNQEGLFRKAGSQIRQKEIISRLDSGNSLGEKNNAIDVANCLKTFFRNLPEPLIPYIYHDLFLRCNMLKVNKINALLLACILLPPHHLNTLAYLMEFLKTVASHEKHNRMGIDNLARVVGPNIMPLQETTMLAVQSRLEAHLTIVKLLIENAEKIGVLPDEISEFISMDTVGSIDNELDGSDPSSSFKSKKKKHRSGSLTRMLSGLKKIVGKNNSPNEMDASENLLAVEPACNLYTPSIKTGKKRKVADSTDSLNMKRQRNVLEVMPASTFGHNYLFSSPVSNNPNPLKEKSPNQKNNGVQKYLSHKVYSDTKAYDKMEKSKKLRLSLDRFVPKPKQKMSEQSTDVRKASFSPCVERRWSSTSDSFDSKKRRRSKSIESPFASPRLKIRNPMKMETLVDEIFMEANVNLSDDCSEQQVPLRKSISDSKSKCKRLSSTRKSTHSYSLRRSSLSNASDNTKATGAALMSEEYVQIPKSEYEEIKSRVSAIESRISQEFKSITNESSNTLTLNPISVVQNEYEKTLEEANIDNIASTDQLAKRLSKELKIRRSGEHKIIRSPSARKIGSLRRRSQERPVRKLQRTVSWHMPVQQEERLNSYCPKQCNLKRGRPLVKADPCRNLEHPPRTGSRHSAPFCSEATNARLNYLQQQLNTLISHTAEHTRGSFDDEDFGFLDDEVFKSVEPSPLSGRSTLNSVAVRRASSFHSGELANSSQYFNNKIKELKKTNSQQNLKIANEEIGASPDVYRKSSDSRKEKTVSWRDADIYFQQEAKLLTPVPQTGRASVAKLRTQNAGMVMAKAKLFDEPSKEVADPGRAKSIKVHVTTPTSSKEYIRTPNGSRRHNNEVIVRRRYDKGNRRTPNASPLIKMEVTVNGGSRRHSTRFVNNQQRPGQDEANPYALQKNNHHQAAQSGPVGNDSSACTTPYIKKPLNVKMPRSAKSLSARKSAINSRRTPMKAVLPITPKRQSPRIILKSTQLSRHMI